MAHEVYSKHDHIFNINFNPLDQKNEKNILNKFLSTHFREVTKILN